MAGKNGLDRQSILATALELADSEGLEAVTMRRIAQRLGVGTMTLYHYVPNKENLLTGLVDLIFKEVEQAPENIESWADRLVFVSLSFRQSALAHPVLVTLVASGYISGPVVLRTTDSYLEAIIRRGFEPRVAAHVYRSAASYVIGYLSLELGGYFHAIEGGRSRTRSLDEHSNAYPHLSEVGPHLGGCSPEGEFEAGLRRLLAGFQKDLIPRSG
ncbi:Tetracyclin repressor, C-terminal all-alpha domain [Rubrobacter radiotolerans]|uniref:TetR/AcrR family transcriptional regulator C-terminal domain-containing protein n=1 Tax=Rubrobacter radiotolerans TaxID=42256 RepID=A0A023X4R4_RUBRA|nr:TetR/AcrR family transcriptional regulator C-terminal domain-containing protein [Rubrobacter radiotolerans]AHY46985.1 Tetracyclin repressor, C-terminal all-alpha domain [Rubrobacter radiotolerans]MDX5894391.1 TetR/AcrR family transcriptional regulator C-terminal domain-containing protein [Rubrobacter radiotolerans]SMC05891.1 transcriptional regulator, TetR family [Rubrobacter radiotolerans DSM 5868]